MRTLEREVIEDLRFEHLEKTVEEDLRNFIRRAYLGEDDAVDAFVKEHAKEPRVETCFIPIDHLRVSEEVEILGLRLLPVDHDEVPEAHPFFVPQAPAAAIAAVPVEGTNLKRMAERAKARTKRSLRVLRMALREHRMIPNEQLRFRISAFYSFGPARAGFQSPTDVSWEVELDEELIGLISSQPLAALWFMPANDIERRAEVAMQWLEDAAFEGEQLKRLLFVFFALEALFGNKAEGLKGHAISFRRAVLSSVMRGAFQHPSRMFDLYDGARSGAVHGEVRPEISEQEINAFAWDARIALNEYLAYAQRIGATKRKDVRASLENEPQATEMIAWIRRSGGKAWKGYLDERDGLDRAKTDEGDADLEEPTLESRLLQASRTAGPFALGFLFAYAIFH